MGYTHYFTLNEELTDKVLRDVKKVLKRYPELVFESDIQSPPHVEKDYIRFNGYGEDGYETFYVETNQGGFCKTNEHKYDLPVCEVLLILKHHYKEYFDLRSDGFSVYKSQYDAGELDGNWDQALENIRKEFGYDFKFIGSTSESGNYTYYSFDIY